MKLPHQDLVLLIFTVLSYAHAMRKDSDLFLQTPHKLNRSYRNADQFPILQKPPLLTGPIVPGFQFKCEIDHALGDNDQRFEVIWTFNGNEDAAVQHVILKGDERVATLQSAAVRGHVDMEVGCKVVTYFERSKDIRSAATKSNTIFFGIQEEPQLTGPIIENGRTFHFQCQVTLNALGTNEQVEIEWTFDGNPDPNIKSVILPNNVRRATLDGASLAGHINKQVGCRARLTYGKDFTTGFRKSKSTVFFGIKVEPNRVDIQGRDDKKDFMVTSTIPILCDQGADCCLTFKINLNRRDVVTIKNSCNIKICKGDWDSTKRSATTKITLVPIRNAISAGTRVAVLTIEDVVLTGTGPYINLFRGHKLNSITVTVHLEQGFHCEMTGDPHFRGVDYKHPYHLYQAGDYIVYTAAERDFTVQIRTYMCGTHVSCVCSIAAKEKNDIISVLGCGRPNLYQSTIQIPYKLSEGTKVQRSNNGAHIGITFPSGSEIKIDIFDWNVYIFDGCFNVYINTPAFDNGKARGICGIPDRNPNNDFTHSNGAVTPVCHPGVDCRPIPFFDSWKVSGKDNLFTAIPQRKKDVTVAQNCACFGTTQQNRPDTCTANVHIPPNNVLCPGCPEITPMLPVQPWAPLEPGINKRSTKEQLHDLGAFDVDLMTDETISNADSTVQWFISQSNETLSFNDQPVLFADNKRQKRAAVQVTKQEATDRCNKSIHTSPLISECLNVDNMFDGILENCVQDFIAGGMDDFVDSAVSSFTIACQMTMAEDEKNYESDTNGVLTLKSEYSDKICPLECLEHGECMNGKCVCKSGWEGDTCHLEKGKGPQIRRNEGLMCHAEKLCQSVDVDVSNVNIMDKLECKVFVLDKQGAQKGEPQMSEAQRGGSLTASCRLPETKLSTQNYTVSLTKDKIIYSNELEVRTYDATCLRCNDSGCVEKTSACHINDVCYENKVRNPQNNRQICDTNQKTNSWSDAPNGAGISSVPVTWRVLLISAATALMMVTGQSMASM